MTTENDETSFDNSIEDAWLPLPKGAEYIIKQIAAEHILHDLLECKLTKPETVDFKLIASLVSQFPGTCHREYDFVWDDGNSSRRLFPLAMVCCLKPPLSAVRAVYNAYPDAVKALESTRGSLPLHFLSAFEASIDVVEFIFSKYEEAANTARKDRVYCIHLSLVYYRGEPSIVNFLLDKCPEAARKLCGNSDWSALHSAVSGAVCDEQILDRLYELHSESLLFHDSHLQTPLHLACEDRTGRDTTPLLRYLAQTAPEAMTMEDRSGLTPIFLAAIHQSVSAIETLLDLVPDVPIVNAQTGATILHWAATHNKTEVVDMIAKRFPEMLTAQTHDEERDTPLSCACYNSAPLSNIRALIRYSPEALKMTDGQGRTLLEAARLFGVRSEIVKLIMEETEKLPSQLLEGHENVWP